MSYILKLVGWYPSKVNAHTGDFVQRHAKSIALYEKLVVIYVVKSAHVHTLTIETHTEDKLTEIICYYPQKKILDSLYSQFYYFKGFRKIIKELFRTHGLPKLVHVNIVWKAGLWALYLKRKFRIPYIITENWTAYYKADPNFIGTKKASFTIIKKIFTKATCFVPVTMDLATTCSSLFKIDMPYKVVENAVDTSLFYREPYTAIKIRIVHVSTMNYQKNTMGLLQTLAVLPLKEYNVEIVLIGPADEVIEEQVNRSEALKNCTILTGNIPYEEVAAYVRHADMLVLFSRYENLPCVIVEALCCGVSVIATNVGGIREIINTRNGILVENEDNTALENALKKMLTTIQTYDRAAIAQDATSKYSYEAIGKKYQQVYAEILK
jgi:glycosyltransferase involved in cell wall biosynthesis